MSIPIADLHCDLLCYLQGDPQRTPFDPIVKCSIPQLMSGPVKTQVMAVFSETEANSSANGMAQLQRFVELKKQFPEIVMFLALENASTLCAENEPIKTCFENLNKMINSSGGVFYISLTWNTENRFGGGAHTTIGLKEDGKRLLDFLHEKQIGLDFSHTSDALAQDLFNYIDKKYLKIPVLASHSNFRAVWDAPRNLPDEFAKEIFKRNGVIGINFVRKFVGPGIVRHFEHGLKLGGENHLCFGADFYYEGDLSAPFRSTNPFYSGYDNASCYQKIIGEMKFSEPVIRKLAHGNFKTFADSHILLSR